MLTIETLQSLLREHKVIPIKFAGQRLMVCAEGVLLWPRESMLIFSDLHLEKGSFLSQFANPLPRLDSRNTIKRIRECIDLYQCKWVVCLGDSLHDANAVRRMVHEDLEDLNALVNSVERWTWVQGNHDPDIPEALAGERRANLCLHKILLSHEAENLASFQFQDSMVTADLKAQIIGHFHPKTSYQLANRKVTGKTFLMDNTSLIMPAFGQYTGGLNSEHAVFNELLNKRSLARYLIYNRRIYHV